MEDESENFDVPDSESSLEEEPAADEVGETQQDSQPESESVTYQVIQESAEPRPFLETQFDDYSVTEGLLLALVLLAFLSACVRIIKEGFSWL